MAGGTLNAIVNANLDVDGVIPLYESEEHSLYWIGSRGEGEEIRCNSYLLIDSGEAMIFEPGGLSHFQPTFDKVSELLSPFEITHMLVSHQDPDVCASLPSWLQFNPDIHIVCPKLWHRFMPHYMVYHANYQLVPDSGLRLPLASGGYLDCISAPYLHSPGNMVVFDSVSGFLFSGDIGAAAQRDDAFDLVIDDWADQLARMAGFHQRYMGSTRAAAAFVERVRGLPITAMLPQHGQIFRGEEVQRFMDWFATLPCGVDFLYAEDGAHRE